jgi:hypothetical protein
MVTSDTPSQPRLICKDFSPEIREHRNRKVQSDLVIVGGGLAGACAAIAAAREGLQVALVQDRPVLGGNASSEVRLWILGATSHMGNNNRWSREGGIIGEFLEENCFRNPEGNPLMVDALLLEMVTNEPNIQLFLNTSVYQVTKSADDELESCIGFCSQNSTEYNFFAPCFMDASGDGVIAFLAGAAFRMGAELRDEFGEKMAPPDSYGHLLGHSLYFYSKDTGRPVEFHAPAFASREIPEIARHRPIDLKDFGCRLWWVEYGGRRDTIHDTEEIKWELWKVVYGIWDYIKNSGKFPEADTHTLEWVGTIPGKRESRRFEGLYMMRQQDIVERRAFDDVIAHGGWALDLHPADGLYSKLPGCNQWHAKGVYGIPLRSFLSRDIRNLVFAGRIISTSHVAFGSTRVMATCGCGAQAVATAVAMACRDNVGIRDLMEKDRLAALQQKLIETGQFLPGIPWSGGRNLENSADWEVSSALELKSIPSGDEWIELTESIALILPLRSGPIPEFRLSFRAAESSQIRLRLRRSDRPGEFTPEITVAELSSDLDKGEHSINWRPDFVPQQDGYYFLTVDACPGVSIRASDNHSSGLLTVYNGIHKAVGNLGIQDPGEDIGVDRFEFWCPRRRPHPQLPHLECSDPVYVMGVDELRNGYTRPWGTPGCWVADPEDPTPCLTLRWEKPVKLRGMVLFFDADFDNAMESVLWGHPDRIAPTCVREFRVEDGKGNVLAHETDNHRSRVEVGWSEICQSDELRLYLKHPSRKSPASLFHLSCF